MTGPEQANLPLDELRARWDAEGPESAIAAARAFLDAHPGDAPAALLLGRMLLAAGHGDEAAAHLLEAARDPALRPEALVGLAPCAPEPMLPEVLALFTSLPDPVEELNEVRYAYGLALWRYGDRAEAIRVWSAIPPQDRRAARAALDKALLAYAEGLLNEGRLGESLATLEGLADPDQPLARGLRRAVASAALAAQEMGLARQAAQGLQDSQRPSDRALCAFVLPRGEERAAGLAALAEDASDAQIAQWAQATAAAEWALQGNYEAALRCLPEGALEPQAAVLRELLRVAAGHPPAEAAGGDVDWVLLRQVASEVPGLLDALAPEPEAADPLRQGAYWLARADHARAYDLLAEAQRQTPWDPHLARNLAVLAFVRALRAAPEVDVEAWRDCFAQVAVVLENPRWLHGWILERLAVYGIRGNERELGDVVKEELRRFLHDQLSHLLAAAQQRGDADAAAAVRGLQAAFARERRAAEAMLTAGGFRGPDDRSIGLGPLLAERTGQLDALRTYFAKQAAGSEELLTDRLRELLGSIGVSDADAEAEMAAGRRPDAELRRWFSELGEAASYAAAGDSRQARDVALRVYARWSPPDRPDAAEMERANPSYAAMPGGVERLRRDAASMVCEMNVEIFSRLLAGKDFDPQAVGQEIERVLKEGRALGYEGPVQRRLGRLIRGKRTGLLQEGSTPSLRKACLLFRHAANAGVEGLEQDRERALMGYAARLYEQKRWRQAAEACEEAWGLPHKLQAVPMCYVASLLQQSHRLERSGCTEEARETIRRARRVAKEAGETFPMNPQVGQLASAVRLIEAGCPIADVLKMPTTESEKAPPLRSMPPDALAALRVCWAARKDGRLAEALDAAERAWQAAPNHPDAAVLVAQTALDLAREGTPERGRELYERAETCLTPMAKRFPAHERLQMVDSILQRDRALYHGDDTLAFLHRKAILLFLSQRHGEAAELLDVVFALSGRQDPEVIALLAAALVEQASSRDAARGREARGLLDRAGQLLAAGADLAPDHYAMAQTREKLSALRSGL